MYIFILTHRHIFRIWIHIEIYGASTFQGSNAPKQKVIWFKVYTKKVAILYHKSNLNSLQRKPYVCFLGWNIVWNSWRVLSSYKWKFTLITGILTLITGDRAHLVGIFQGLNPDVGDWIFHTSPGPNEIPMALRSAPPISGESRCSVRTFRVSLRPVRPQGAWRGSFGGFLVVGSWQ